MEKNTISSVQDAIPSTSKAANKNQEGNTRLPHIIPLPSNPQAKSNMRVLQLAPIQSLPKGNIKLIKLDASTASLLNMNVLQTRTNKAAIKNLKPVQLKIPINMSTPPNHTPILTISPTKSVPVISTQNTSNNSATSEPILVGPKHSPTKKYQPNIIQRKTPTKSSEVTDKEKVIDSIIKKQNADTSVKVKNFLRKAKNQTAREKKLQNEGGKHVLRRNRGNISLKQEKETAESEEMSLYVADGFRADVETLMEKCSHVYKLNFEKFSDIWKEMRFSRIFHERQSGAELAEFTEEAIYIAKSYMVATSVSFEENVAGLFLVYALLNLQPFPGFAPLRLVPSDVPSILALKQDAWWQRRHDVLYVLGHVLVRSTHAHVTPRETGLELPLRKYYDGTVQVLDTVESVFTRNAECVRNLRQLVQLEQRYHALRTRLQADKIRNLCSQPAAALLRAYNDHIPSALHTETSTEVLAESPKKEENPRIDLMKSIRERAMTNAVDSMRHLTGVAERLHELSSSDDEAASHGRSKERKRYKAAAVQQLFTTPKPKEVDAPTPSSKEMPNLDGFGELGSDVNTSSVNTNNNPNTACDTQILRDLLTKPRIRNRREKYKNVSKKPSRRRKLELVDSDFQVASIEAEAHAELSKGKRKYTRKKPRNTKKGSQEKGNSSNNDLNTKSDTSSKEQLAENSNNDDAGNAVQNMTREEEISYLRSIIEEIEGSIEQDPTQPATNQQTNVQNTRKVIEIETVECEFVGSPKTSKRKKESETEDSDEKKPKIEPKKCKEDTCDTKGEDSKKKTSEVQEIFKEPSSSSMNKTPKAQVRQSGKKSSPINETTVNTTPKSRKNVAKVTSPKTYVSLKIRNTGLTSPNNIAGTSVETYESPKTVRIKSLTSPRRDIKGNVESPKTVDGKTTSPKKRKKCNSEGK